MPIKFRHVAVNKSTYKFLLNDYNKDWSRAIIELPDDSPYAGYHAEVISTACDDLHGMVMLRLYPNDIYTLVKTKTKSDKGKRFARPKISGKELYDCLKPHEFDTINDANLWLAETTDYADNGLFKYRHLSVGCLEGKFFYETDGYSTKRRIVNSFGLTLLRPLNYDDAVRYGEYKKVLHELSEREYVNGKRIERFKSFLSDFSYPDTAELEKKLLKAYEQNFARTEEEQKTIKEKYADLIPDCATVLDERKKHLETRAEAKKNVHTRLNKQTPDNCGGK